MTAEGYYDLTCGKFDGFLLPRKANLAKALARVGNRDFNSAMNYCEPYGASDLREVLAANILPERGIERPKETVIITNGALHAISLLAIMLTHRYENPTVAVEIPGYAGFRKTLRMFGVRVLPLQVDQEGARPEPEILSQCNAVILTPGHHFPTNVTMSAARRADFCLLAEEEGFFLVEDDYSRGFTFWGEEHSPLTANSIHGNGLYIGSFSKNLAPGLRQGFIVAGPQVIEELSTIRWRIDRHSPELLQLVLAQLIRSGEYTVLERRTRESYRRRWLTMKTLLEKHFDLKSKCTGGMSFWLPTSISWQSLKVIGAHLSSQGVWFTSGYDCFDKEPEYGVMRLGYTCANTNQIRVAIGLLAQSFREITGLSPRAMSERSPNEP